MTIAPTTESVASIFKRDSAVTIQNCLARVEQNSDLTSIPLSRDERIGHLPKLFRDLVLRLQFGSGAPALISGPARQHGRIRRHQGYTAPMLVEESRILEVSIFTTLHRNRCRMDRRQVLLDVVTIADEVDSQLKQAISCHESAPQ
jgi:hypothetical protein